MATLASIQHNLEMAKPAFLHFINHIDPKLSKWIQYKGFHVEGSRLYFNFKSSQNSLSFTVHASLLTEIDSTKLYALSEEIYNFFKAAKYEALADKN